LQIFANILQLIFAKRENENLKDKEQKVKSSSLDQVDSSLILSINVPKVLKFNAHANY